MQFTLTIELPESYIVAGQCVIAMRLADISGQFWERSDKRLMVGESQDIYLNEDDDRVRVGKWEVRDAPVRLTNAERYGRDGSRTLRLDPDALAAAE